MRQGRHTLRSINDPVHPGLSLVNIQFVYTKISRPGLFSPLSDQFFVGNSFHTLRIIMFVNSQNVIAALSSSVETILVWRHN